MSKSITIIDNEYTTASGSNSHYAIQKLTDVSKALTGISQQVNTNSFITDIILFPFNVKNNVSGYIQNRDILGVTRGFMWVGGKLIDMFQEQIIGQTANIPFNRNAIYRVSNESSFSSIFVKARSIIVKSLADITIDADYYFTDYQTKIELFLPFMGWVELDPVRYIGQRISVQYLISLDDGTALIQLSKEIYDEYGNPAWEVMDSYNCQVGVKLPFATSDKAIKDVSNAVALLGVITSVAGGIASGNPIVAGTGILHGIQQLGGMATNTPTASKNAGSMGLQNFYQPTNVLLRITRPVVVRPVNYEQLYGRPCERYLQLGTLTGFTKVRDIHLENFEMATDEELDEIETLLKTGVIL